MSKTTTKTITTAVFHKEITTLEIIHHKLSSMYLPRKEIQAINEGVKAMKALEVMILSLAPDGYKFPPSEPRFHEDVQNNRKLLFGK